MSEFTGKVMTGDYPVEGRERERERERGRETDRKRERERERKKSLADLYAQQWSSPSVAIELMQKRRFRL